jgi:L-ascorbate metabolism protein UlaG (beta-lactamase superfamily)
MSSSVYLKPNVLAEPLFNQWYAWSYLLSPATAAMYVRNWHMRLMQSFVAAPQTHTAALKNPAMIGGPFINYDASRVGEIRELMDRTARENRHLIEFSEALQALDETLSTEATGYSLESLYPRVPDVLKGYVELVYDLNTHASIRLIEGLLYKSRYYNKASQAISLSLVEKDGRDFVFSTPRLKEKDGLHLNIAFDEPVINELFKMREHAQPFGYIKEALKVSEEDGPLMSTFFTSEAPRPCSRYDGDSVRVRYLGHASILIESKEVSILSDPIISYEYDSDVARYTYADLPGTIDYVFITHNHQDHCLFESLLQLRHKIKNLIVPKSSGGSLMDPCLKSILQNAGFKNVVEIGEMETLEVEGGSILGLPFLGEHADLNIRTKMAFQVNLKGKSILCAADSNNIEPMLYEHIYEATGALDMLFLGMECVGGPMTWLYGPLLTKPLSRKMDQSRRFDGSDYQKALQIVERMKPAHVYVYAMGHEPWLTFLTSIQYNDDSRQILESNNLVEDCRSKGIISERLFGRKEIYL